MIPTTNTSILIKRASSTKKRLSMPLLLLVFSLFLFRWAAASCGDGILQTASEDCDDGNKLSGDGCSATCKVEDGFECITNSKKSQCKEICGDGINLGHFGCDDGNKIGGDGCSSTCFVEAGWDCGSGKCLPICGDGINTGGLNECDDGNLSDGDGCSSQCTTEPGWICRGAN